MQHTITLNEVLTSMDTGMPFSIGFVTANQQLQKGGEYIFLEQAVKRTKQPTNHTAHAPLTAAEASKNPNHYSNSTRNIVNMINARIVKIHLRLIVTYNGKTVI